MKNLTNNWRQLDVRIYAVLASFILSALTLIFPHAPNDDAFTYIRTAEIFLNEGFSAAYQHYAWASYSILMGLLSLLGIDLFSAGLLINAFFYAMLAYGFVSILKEIDNSKSLLVLASISILVYPQLNEYRYLVIRDVGFWALSILALVQYLQFARSQAIASALAFCALFLLATTFRPEAIAYLLLTPFAIFFDSRHETRVRKRLFFTLIGIILAAAVLGIILLSIMGIDVAGLFVRFVAVYQPFISSTFSPDPARLSELSQVLFNEYAAAFSQEYISIFMAAGFVAILFANLFNAIGGPYLIILAIGFLKKHIRLGRELAAPLIIFCIVNFIVLLIFLSITRFLTSRYAMLSCIVLIVLVPIILCKILADTKTQNRKVTYFLISVFLAYCAFDSYYSFGVRKDYVFDSIEWLDENSDDSSGLLSNNATISYFSGKVEDYDQVPRYLSKQLLLSTRVGDIIAVELNYETEQVLADASVAPYLELQAAFPDMQQPRIVFYLRINP